MTIGKTTKHRASGAFRPADYIHGDSELAVFLKELLADGEVRMIPVALHTAADVLGMTELARRTGVIDPAHKQKKSRSS